MRNIKTILLSWSIIIFSCLFLILFLKINNLNNIISGGWESNLINITPTEKSNTLQSLQNDIKDSIYSTQNSIAAIYAKQKIWSVVEAIDWTEKQVETVESLEWNAIVIANDWYMITNKHVVPDLDKTSYKAILQWEEYSIDKIWYDKLLDIAVIKIKTKGSTTPAIIAKMDGQAEIWDIVFAIKNDPEIWEYITKIWLVNSKNQKFEIQNNNDIYVWLIKNSTAIEWWFSGWPLINLKWDVIWMNTAIDNIEYSASYALPLSQEFINQTLSSIKESWQIIRPYLWIQYTDSDFYVKVTEIFENSPASKTELAVWDIILWINDLPVSYNDFLYNLYTYKVGKQITLNIMRDWHKKDIQITIWKE